MKKFGHTIQFLILGAIRAVMRNVPYTWSFTFGGLFTGVAWHLGIRRKVARKNFEIVFGNRYSAKERDRILYNSYVNFGRSMVEFTLQSRFTPSCLRNIVDMSDAISLEDTRESKNGAILVTGHLGSWELLGASLVAHKFPIDFLVGEQSNKKVDKMMNNMRKRMMIGIIHMGVAVRGVLRSLKKGRMVALLSDQDAGHAGIEVEMFDQKVMTPSGPAAFHLKTGAPIIVGIIVRQDDKYSHKLYTEKIDMPCLTGENKEDVEIITQLYTDKLAAYIEKYPEMWFWPHRRFKRSVSYK
jgi:KDO2-lipid IV(A) lauroyltransferase